MIIPTNPNRPPPSRIENTTQNADNPVELPKIFGPITFPSSCCSTRMKIRKYTPLIGSFSKIRTALGIAPIYGPKKGITLVTPTITLIKSMYGIFRIVSPKKQSTPIIIESMIFPIINPPKISLLFFVRCRIILA
jgi:hypothetical protein